MLLSDYLQEYLLERDVAASTSCHLATTIRKFGDYLGRPALLSDLSDSTVNAYLAAMLGGYTPRSIRSRRVDLLALWRSAYESGYVEHGPRKVRRIKVPDKIPSTWSPVELGELAQAAAGESFDVYWPNGVHAGQFWGAFIRFVYDTGLRLSDTLQLQKCHISPAGVVGLVQCKTGRRHYARIRPATLAAVNQLAEVDGRAFAFPFSRAQFWVHWRRLLEAAGLPYGKYDNGPHKLRRTSATELARVAPVEVVSQFLGHSPNSGGLAKKHYLGVRAFESLPMPPECAIHGD